MEIINFQEINKAAVYVRDLKAGYLERISQSDYLFKYTETYLNDTHLPAISASLPKIAKDFRSKKLHPFFDNLIAEGWLLQHTEKVFHIDKKNRFSLLMATGSETIGAITLKPLDSSDNEINLGEYFKDHRLEGLVPFEAQPVHISGRCPYCMKRIKPSEISHLSCTKKMWQTTRPLKILLNADNQITTFSHVIYGGSISGAQRKGMFTLDRKTGILEAKARNSEYIFKPNGDFPELPENEHIGMSIARHAGFKVPPFVLMDIKGLGRVFAIKRFDRERKGEGLVKYLQEDMGQITASQSDDKYNSSCEKIVSAIKKTSSMPIVDIANYFERLIFCFLIGNADMHLKNWSMLELSSRKNIFTLSPVYDPLNTRLAIPNEAVDIGLPIRGKSRKLQLSYFKAFAKDAEIEDRIVNEILGRAENWIKLAKPLVEASLLSANAKENYCEILDKRHKLLFG